MKLAVLASRNNRVTDTSGSVRCAHPLLLALVDGVSPAQLRAVAHAAELPVRSELPLHLPADGDAAAGLAGLDATAPLRDLGLAVDRRSLCLRPRWRGDEAGLEWLGRRPAGPAAVTMLHLRDPLLEAALHGPESAAAAAATGHLLAQLQTAQRRLRDGEQPETWLLATGSLVPVHTTFHFGRALRRRLAWPRRGHRSTITVLPELARVHPDCEHTRQRLIATLQAPPFARYGQLADCPRGDELWFVPFDGCALGSTPLRGRRDLSLCLDAAALLPVPVRTERALTLAGVMARLCMRAVELLQVPSSGKIPAPTSLPPDLPIAAGTEARVELPAELLSR